MGMMSGMTAGSGTMGTVSGGAHDSKMGTYSGMRSSGKGSHSVRPVPNVRSGMDAY